ncbi:hypothetical protein [Myxococcus sp. Y35]|uniref:hypothetical protein n=1 Tax=Pseudomyxococcus flavus TaxID=3115648 RepID=UPI003CF1E46E
MPTPRMPTFPASPRVPMPNVSSPRSSVTACALLLGCLLSTGARAAATDAPLQERETATPAGAPAADAPLQEHEPATDASLGQPEHFTPDESPAAEVPLQGRESGPATPVGAPATDAPLRQRETASSSSAPAAVPTYIEPEDVPLPTGAAVAHGAVAAVPVVGIWGATRVGGDTRLGATATQTAAGMLLGYMPSSLLSFRPAAPSPERWMELETVAFGAGFVLTPPLAALGTWGLGELAFGRSQHQGRAYLGALGGAAVGTLLGVIAHEALVKLSRPSAKGKSSRQLIALGFIGAGATLGYQWAGGGPRSDGPAR